MSIPGFTSGTCPSCTKYADLLSQLPEQFRHIDQHAYCPACWFRHHESIYKQIDIVHPHKLTKATYRSGPNPTGKRDMRFELHHCVHCGKKTNIIDEVIIDNSWAKLCTKECAEKAIKPYTDPRYYNNEHYNKRIADAEHLAYFAHEAADGDDDLRIRIIHQPSRLREQESALTDQLYKEGLAAYAEEWAKQYDEHLSKETAKQLAQEERDRMQDERRKQSELAAQQRKEDAERRRLEQQQRHDDIMDQRERDREQRERDAEEKRNADAQYRYDMMFIRAWDEHETFLAKEAKQKAIDDAQKAEAEKWTPKPYKT